MPRSNSSKNFLREFSLIRLYTVLSLSFLYFVIQLVVAHITHSLILQVDSYHMLYNILSLCTSIVTTKMCRNESNVKNTFGWTRIDVCGAVASLCFLSALCFSVVIEALQAMLHVSHHEKMSKPIWIGAVGILGLIINAATCVVIGGYTYHQKGFLGSHKDGEDIVISPSARRGPKSSSSITRAAPIDTFRDFFGCAFVIITAAVVHFWKHDLADFVDPSLTILEVFILAGLSYKYAREAGYILLLTIPDHINVESLLSELCTSFPEVDDIHEFHVWQLTPERIIASAHIVLKSTKDCWTIQNNIVDFLQTKGISQVTLQPEFLELNNQNASPQTLKRRQCLVPCSKTEDCQEKKCCVDETLLLVMEGHGHNHGHGHGHSHRHELSNEHRSQSLHSFPSKDNTVAATSCNIKPMKSNPELKISSTDLISDPNDIEVRILSPPKVTIEDDCDSDLSEDEANQELKPMI